MAAELNDQEFGSSSESRWIAHVPGMVPGMVQEKFEKFDKEVLALVFMVVILALVSWMLKIAGKFVKELAREEFSLTVCGSYFRKKISCLPTLPWLDACRQCQASGSVCSMLPRRFVSA